LPTAAVKIPANNDEVLTIWINPELMKIHESLKVFDTKE
jgi:hypothetical protein